MKTVCVLKSGGQYTADHVRWLQAQRPGLWLWCLSDVPVRGVPTLPLRHDLPGWWSKIEAFGPAFSEDLLYLDLDSVVVGPLDDLMQAGRTTLCSDFLKPEHANSSVMYLAQADKARVYHRFLTDPHGTMNTYRQWPGQWGDQGFIADCLPDAARWPDEWVRSYRVHCQSGVPDGCRVVAFHGKPKPWQIAADWIPPFDAATPAARQANAP
jgi:hypothetical protein